ncbi:hypothetical protein PLICRDRAFT_100242 [Plicaturopsis crispa FD-325 SS-3]|nr:hypothetical protein PLICRDRAFT_100242 [Plicaturopsis crispa FD-325 SS-3]
MTPTFSETAQGLKKTLSFKTLNELQLDHVTGQVWRKQDEPPRRPRDLEQLLVHAVANAGRAFGLAWSIRTCISLVFAILGLIKKRKLKGAVIVNALLGEESIRFGSMFGAFVFLWKTSFHGLRLFNPGPKGPGRIEPWHAPLAGAISGLAVLAEKKANRITVSQQLFVRGLQGMYNIAHKRGLVNIPHGDVLLFGLSCGQIMYGWLISPESLPKWYNQWISNASQLPFDFIEYNVARKRTPNVLPPLKNAEKILQWERTTPYHRRTLANMVDKMKQGDYGYPFAPCQLTHPHIDSCVWARVDKFRAVFQWMIPAYAALHFIPPILFKRKQFFKDPSTQLTRSLLGTLRSSSFLSTFVVIVEVFVCFNRNAYIEIVQYLPKSIQKIWLSKYYYWLAGFATCLSMFVEEKKRPMYVLPKALESLWNNGRKRGHVPFIPGGEVILASGALAMVMGTYQRDPASLSGLVRSILYQFIGRS